MMNGYDAHNVCIWVVKKYLSNNQFRFRFLLNGDPLIRPILNKDHLVSVLMVVSLEGANCISKDAHATQCIKIYVLEINRLIAKVCVFIIEYMYKYMHYKDTSSS